MHPHPVHGRVSQRPARRSAAALFGLGLACWLPVSGLAASCPALPNPAVPDTPSGLAADDPRIRISADLAEMFIDRTLRLEGHVRIEQAGRVLEAGQVDYDLAGERAHLRGGVRILTGAYAVEAPETEIRLADETAEIPAARFRLQQQDLRGMAEQIRVLDRDRLQLERASLTSCPPQREDWLLSARDIHLDQQSGRGTARHALLRFMRVPILYTPWIDFPIDDRRKTGFLYPEFGSSSQRGAELAVPWYWNIAPNYDATLTPRYMSHRGAGLDTEFRYLHRHNTGKLQFDWLPRDRARDGTERWYGGWRHDGHPLARLRSRVVLDAASDSDYFNDFATNLALASTSHLQRLGELEYRDPHISALLRVESFQTLDQSIAASARPYQRLPQLRLGLDYPNRLGLDWSLDGEWVHYWRENSVTTRRLDLTPRVSLPLQRPWGYARPSLAWRMTQYQLDNRNPGEPTAITRALPVFALDGGLYFDRLDGRHRQTLEPRIYYLYKPYRDQTDIPLFDTGLASFSFGQMFRPERFTGPDRVGDANQLTLALTSRWLTSGRELGRISGGIVRYFDSRRVTLPGALPETDTLSDAALELSLTPHPMWRGNASLLWNPGREETVRSSFGVQYRRDGQRVINLGYRYDRDNFEQTDLSAAWKLTPAWLAVARWNHSLRDDSDIETLAGLEYDSCCWRLRMVARRFVGTTPGEYHTGVQLQLVLKGLGALGDRADRTIQREIPGLEIND